MANANGSRIAFILIVILILNLNLRASQPIVSSRRSEELLDDARHALSCLSNSTWGSFTPWAASSSEDVAWLNLTGLRATDQYAWSLLPAVQQKVRDQITYNSGEEGLQILEGSSNSSVLQYRNATSWLRGRWVRDGHLSSTSPPQVNLSATAPSVSFSDRWETNITGKEGKMQLKLEEYENDDSDEPDGAGRRITGVLTIQDESSVGDGWETGMNGVHFRDSATIVLTTDSPKFDGLAALPHLTLTNRSFVVAKEIVNKTLSSYIESKEANVASMSPEEIKMSRTETPRCEMIAYIQFKPLAVAFNPGRQKLDSSVAFIETLEKELTDPTGASLRTVPELEASLVVFSPDCGFVITSQGPPEYALHPGHAHGQRPEVQVARGKVVVLAFIVVLSLQVALVVKQMRDSRTPTAKSRISFYTIAMFSLGKGLTWITFMVMASIDNPLYLLYVIVAFFSFLGGNFLCQKFMLDIWSLQENERFQPERQHVAEEPRGQPSLINGPNDSIRTEDESSRSSPAAVLEVSTPSQLTDTGASPLPVPSSMFTETIPNANDTTTQASSRASFGSVYTKFYLILLVMMFISVHASAAWSTRARSIYANFLAMIYLSIWFPQIYRNIIRNCRKALSWTFVIGESLLNLIPIAYFWGFEDNILYIEPDRHMLLMLIGLVWIQWLALAAQEILGPRFFVSEKWSWVPHAWDYHPILKEDEESGSLPLGLSGTSIQEDQSPGHSNSGKNPSPGQKIYDCAICMQDIEVPVMKQEEATTSDIIAASINSNFLARRNYMVTRKQCNRHESAASTTNSDG